MSKKTVDAPPAASPGRSFSLLWPMLAAALLLIAVGGWFALDHAPSALPPTSTAAPRAAPTLVDEASCQGCHSQQVEHWKGSHHQLAMQTASADSVLGNFANASFKSDKETTRFFRRGEAFWVNTPGADGRPRDFPVAYAFGIEPLQQYLIDTGGGHLQALGVAWDTQKKRWFHLYPGQGVDFKDPLHWSKPQQNANFMCVECHTTGYTRNFEPVSATFDSRWNSLGVGCQACHGPASAHVQWAQEKPPGALAHSGFQQSLVSGSSLQEVETCARCHARRAPLGDGFVQERRLMDDYLPSRLTRELYALDGKIKDEVFEYGAFTQSKMFAKGVRCSNCHEPHSTALKAPGNGVCLQCHNPAGKRAVAGVDGAGLKASDYESAEHHRHTPGQPGSQCVDCHMPGKFYMVNDWRHDHGFSIPAPTQALALGTADACLGCHKATAGQKVAEQFRLWYGDSQPATPGYAQSLGLLRDGKAGAAQALFSQLQDGALPAIRRATLLAELANYPSPRALRVASKELSHEAPMVRLAALEAVAAMTAPQQRLDLLNPRLRDPVLAVRIAAAYALLSAQAQHNPAFDQALGEYEQVQLSLLERAEANLNLAMLYGASGRNTQVEGYLRSALQRDPDFLPAIVALAQWLDSHGRAAEGQALLDSSLKQHPQAALLHHAKGLALIRQGQREQALVELRSAVRLAPEHAGYGYVLAVALHDLGQREPAMQQLWDSLDRQPYNRDVRLALMHYLQEARQVERANGVLEALRQINPEDPLFTPRS